jgi:excisionase family DNA binding protein
MNNTITNVPYMAGIDELYNSYKYLSRQFLYRLAKSGKVKAVKAGNKILINVDSLNDYLRSGDLADESPPSVAGIRILK